MANPTSRAPEKQPESAFRLEVLPGSIALVTFDLPNSRANTLGQAVLAELASLIAQVSGRTDLRGLIFRSGKPGMFIAGADLRELGSAQPEPAQTRALVQRGHDLLKPLEALPYPTVAAIEGACMGGGLELAMGFDFRLASSHPKTELGLPEVKIGLFPGWGGTQRLPRLIGPALAGSWAWFSMSCPANACWMNPFAWCNGPSNRRPGARLASASSNRSA